MTNTPILSAKQLLSQYAIEDPTDVPIEDLIWAQGGIYQEKVMNGAEGRIIFAGANSAFIVVNKKITNHEKKRFIRAHELGHFRLHRSLSPFFNCDVQSFMERNKQGSHESEANSFAAELLMPASMFSQQIAGQSFSIELLKQTAKRFQTSLMATSFRYSELGPEPIAFFYSQGGQVKWVNKSADFIATYLPNSMSIPIGSVTYRYLTTGTSPTEPDLVPGDVWFKSRRIPSELLFFEQCVPYPSSSGAVTYIWMSGQFK
jgi:hypothetical protein